VDIVQLQLCVWPEGVPACLQPVQTKLVFPDVFLGMGEIQVVTNISCF